MTASTAFDIPQPWASLVAAAVITATAFLMLVDWTHPTHHDQENR
ncbi:hypothetical protein [Streptomyces griseosporeus]